MRSTRSVPLTLRAPGWYPDPTNDVIGAERWWDGTAWGDAARRPEDLDRAPVPRSPTPAVLSERGRFARLLRTGGGRRPAQ